LEDDRDGTILKIADSYIGHISKKAEESFETGWMTIFSETFKPYVEKKTSGD
jgi:hypothetical protein